MNAKADIELKRLMQEKEELTRRLDVVVSNIQLINKLFATSSDEEIIPTLAVAAIGAMESLKRFTKSELAARIKHLYPAIEFSEGSLFKPMKRATENGQIRMAQPSQGNKKQAIYEWLEKE